MRTTCLSRSPRLFPCLLLAVLALVPSVVLAVEAPPKKILILYSYHPGHPWTDSRLGLGIVGGKLVSGHSRGCAAANTVLRLLRGERLVSEAALVHAENRCMFDYVEMVRFGIPLSALPPGSEVIAQPPKFYAVHRSHIQYERILGLRPENVIGRLATDVYGTPEPPYLTEYGRVVLSGRAERLEVHFAPMGKDFDISVAPWGANGFATIFEDVTDRKRAEVALREREERYRARLASRTDLVFVLDRDGRFTDYHAPKVGDLTFETDVAALGETDCRNSPFEIVPGQYLSVSITDTGCGMSDEVKKHLFEPFFTTKQPGQGTGMGLASVYGAVRNHRGAISVSSAVGRGTTVRIFVPLAPQTLELGEVSDPGPAAALVQGTARILLVDDEASVRDVAADMLRGLGYSVVTCVDGREAVEYYRQNWQQVDLVVLDLVMPELGGRDTFVAMRRINPKIRALLSSGYSLDGEAQAILDEGVLAFVGKPYRQAELGRKVAEALAERLG